MNQERWEVTIRVTVRDQKGARIAEDAIAAFDVERPLRPAVLAESAVSAVRLRAGGMLGPVAWVARAQGLVRDVAVATEEPRGLSTQNILPVTLAEIAEGSEPGEAFLRLAAGPTVILARVTRDSVARLHLRPGMPLWALVKAVTFDHRVVGSAAAPAPQCEEMDG
jgi:molybdopterin-binding protein